MNEPLQPRPNGSTLPMLEVPSRWRAFVYIVGMLGFPVVIAFYVLVVLSVDLKQVNGTLTELATRIDERPMGIEKSTDFIVYLTDALRADIQAGFLEVSDSLIFSTIQDREAVSRTVTIIKRELDGYIRPIVRRHQRFAARFPTDGGSLGALFGLSSVADDVEAGQTDAHLVGRTRKEFSEALSAMLMNNLAQFGQVREALDDDAAADAAAAELEAAIQELLGGLDSAGTDEELTPQNPTVPSPSAQPEASNSEGELVELIDRELFYRLSMDSIETATTVMRDQMLEAIRLNSTELQ